MIEFAMGFCAGVATVWINVRYGHRIDAAAGRCRRWIISKFSPAGGRR